MKRHSRKQISFDLDSTVLKAMFGEKNYVRGWHDIQKFMGKMALSISKGAYMQVRKR